MKKISKLLALATGFATLFFAACSDVDSGSVSEGINNQTNNAKNYEISFAAADGTPIDMTTLGVTKNESSRSIVATDQDLSTYKYYLWGYDLVAKDDVDPVQVEFEANATDTTKGSVTLDIKVSNYKLVLAAVKATDATTLGSTPDYTNITPKALYIGYANVDLRNTSTIQFYITTDGLEGDAGFDLTVVYDGLTDDDPKGTWTADHKTAVSVTTDYKISAKIVKRTDGSTVAGGDSGFVIANDDFFNTGSNTPKGSVAPGTYNFVVYFKDLANNNKVYEYSDIIILLPNQTVTATVKVPDVIDYVPNTPKDLKVGYVKPDTSDIGTYDAVLSWTDNSVNESYFLIEIVDVSRNAATISADIKTPPASGKESDPTDSGNVASLEAWDAATLNCVASDKLTLDKDFYGDSMKKNWVAGSLQRNNTEIVVKLALGKPYVMRIAAVNDAGQSKTYAYATYDLNKTWTDTDTYHTGSYDAKPYAIKGLNFNAASPYEFKGSDLSDDLYVAASTPVYGFTANLYRLTYNLNGGIFTASDTINTSKKIVAYLTQEPTTGIPVLAPFRKIVASTGTQLYPTLINSGNSWTSWRKDVVEGDNYDDTDPKTDEGVTYYNPGNYKGYANLNLFASYAVSAAAVEAYLDRMYDFIDGEVAISITGIGSKVNDHSYVVYNGTTELNLSYTFKDTITGTPAITRAAFNYSSLFATVKASRGDTEYARSDFASNACSLNIGNIPGNKKYLITVIGEYKGHQYSYPIVIEFQDNPNP